MTEHERMPPHSPRGAAGAGDSDAGTASNALAGIGFMVASVGLFAVMDAVVKWLGGSYPIMQIVFFRSVFALIPLSYLVWRMGGLRQAFAINNPLGHVKRAITGVIAITLFFYSYTHMRLADAIAISFAAPLFITALSVPMLGERVGVRRWSACLVGFVGVVIMVNPGAGVFDPTALAALAGTFAYALAVIYVRQLSRSESNVAIVMYFTLATAAISAAALPFGWVTPDVPDFGLLVALGLIGGLAQILMTKAFRAAEVSIVMPFEYTAMFYAVFLGWLLWDELPGVNIWIGSAVVAASGLYILFRESALGRRRVVAKRLPVRR